MFAHMPIIRDIIYGAASRGADFNSLCSQIGIDSEDLHDSELKLDFERSYRTWELAVKMTGNHLLGLHLGESTNPSILGLIGHLMQTSRTLQEAFEKVCEYGEMATDMFSYSIRKHGVNYILHFEPAPLWVKISPDSSRQAVDQAMAGTVHVFEMLSGKVVTPLQVNFKYTRSASLREYERVFPCEIRFGAKDNQLLFNQHQLELPVISYDRSIHHQLDKALQDKKTISKKNEGIVDQLKNIILRDFKGQTPPIEVLASFMHVTPRTLQRRLAAQQTTYRALSAGIKMELATQWLSSEKIKISTIASILGYSEPSAFRRAYKSWMASRKPRQRGY
jgi:AraC-like DNA-binding protein